MTVDRRTKVIGAIIFLLSVGNLSFAQTSPLGKWKTIDDDSGKPKSIVEIYEQGGQLFGRIIQLFLDADEDPNPICDKCTDHRKDKRIIGMTILNNMEKDDDEWAGGRIMDPENGKTYRCRIWLEHGTLKVRGYIAFLFRTQTWLPA